MMKLCRIPSHFLFEVILFLTFLRTAMNRFIFNRKEMQHFLDKVRVVGGLVKSTSTVKMKCTRLLQNMVIIHV